MVVIPVRDRPAKLRRMAEVARSEWARNEPRNLVLDVMQFTALAPAGMAAYLADKHHVWLTNGDLNRHGFADACEEAARIIEAAVVEIAADTTRELPSRVPSSEPSMLMRVLAFICWALALLLFADFSGAFRDIDPTSGPNVWAALFGVGLIVAGVFAWRARDKAQPLT